jgi:hypothetical protein
MKREKDGQLAKGHTAQEVGKYLSEVVEIIERDIRPQHPAAFTSSTGEPLPPLFCFDRPNVHKGIDLWAAGINPCIQLWDQPTYGPDFNRAIEHVWGPLAGHWKGWCDNDRNEYAPEVYHKKAEELWKACAQQSSIKEDVMELPEMYTHIAAEVADGGSAGGWPPAEMR